MYTYTNISNFECLILWHWNMISIIGTIKSLTPFQVFFVERVFKIFDSDGNGDISLAKFIDAMYQFAGKGQAEKILFLFKIYDINGTCKV